MTRLAATMHADARLQLRQGFYYASAFVLVIMVVVLRQVPAEFLTWLLPVVILSNVQVNTFYFIAGLVLLEKSEGTLEAQVVTPLRPREYLASKIATLTGLSVLENVTLVVATHGAIADAPALLAGVLLSSLIFALTGFLAVARYDSINEYLMPSFLFTTLLSIPLLPYFGLIRGPLFDLHPVTAPLDLLRVSLDPSAAARWPHAVASAAVWVTAGALLCGRAFRRFVIAREGARRS